jgi:hypothetical protein
VTDLHRKGITVTHPRLVHETVAQDAEIKDQFVATPARAFSGEVDTGSSSENATKQDSREFNSIPSDQML